jgi:hypothetical protein
MSRLYDDDEAVGARLIGLYDLQRQDEPDEAGYTIVIYDKWEGDVDPDDPSASVERRVAYFQDNAPEVGFDIVAAVQSGYGNYWRYNGLPNAIMDHELESVQKADREAQQFRQQSESVNRSPKDIGDDYYSRNELSEAEAYEKFWAAVEALRDDPEDEGANNAIKAFREERHDAVYRKGKSGY